MLVGPLIAVVDRVARRPVLSLLVAGAALLLSALSLSHLRIDSTLSGMLGGNNPAAEALARITDDFHAAEDLLVLASAPDTLPVHEAEERLLAFASRLESAAAVHPDRQAITGIRYLPDPAFESYIREVVVPAGALWLDDAGFTALLARLRPEEVRTQMAQNAAMLAAPGPGASELARQLVKDPLRLREFFLERLQRAPGDARGAFFSDDRHALLIRISGARPVNDIEFSKHFTRAVESLAREANSDGLEIRIGGGYAVAATTASTIRHDAIVSTISSGVLVYLVLALAYRRWLAPLSIVLTAGTGVLVAFGLYACFVSTITPLTAVLAGMLAGLGVEYAVHMRSHHDLFVLEGLASRPASVRAARELVGPLIAVCFTSVFGFGAIDLSGVRMLKDFANMGCVGLLGALLAAWLVLPALLAVLPLPVRPAEHSDRWSFPRMLVDAVAAWPRRMLATGIALTLIALGIIASTPGFLPAFESETSVLHPHPNAPLEAGRIIRERFRTAGESLFVRITGNSADELAERSHDIADRLATQEARREGVLGTLGLASLVPDPRRAGRRLDALAALDAEALVAGVEQEIAASEFDAAAFSDYFAFLRSFLGNRRVPRVADVLAHPEIARQLLPASSVDRPELAPRQALVLVTGTSAASTRRERAEFIDDVRRLIADVPGTTLTGLVVVSHDLEVAARRDAFRFGLLSIALVIGWLFFYLRRIVDVLLAFIPVVFSLLCVLAAMSAAGDHLNPVNVAAIPLLAGIAVDSGIYLVAAARRPAASLSHGGEDRRQILRPTVHAILCTTGATVLGFGTLLITHTPAVRSLGLVMVVGVATSVLACLLILLPLLFWNTAPAEEPA